MPNDPNEAAAAKLAEDRRKAREAANKSAEAEVDAQAKEQAANNMEAMKRMEGGKPTPTQRENDLARLGVQVLEHEDDGSGPDPHNLTLEESTRRQREDAERRRTSVASSGGAPYQTRQAAPAPTPARTPMPKSE